MESSGYSGFAAYYDRLMSDVDYPALAEYFDELLHNNGAKGGILLDLACGTGTLSVLLAQRGWNVIAADVSGDMLANAKAHEQVSYICQDMTELDLYGTIDAAVCSFDGFNHLPDKSALLKALKRVSLFMNAQGVFVFDLNTIYKHETILADNIFVKESDGVCCVWRNEYQGGGTVDIALDIFAERKDGAYERFTADIRETAYDFETVRELCKQAEFEVVGCLDFMTQNNINETSEKAVFVCKVCKTT